MASRLSTGDTSLLASTHAVSSGLKVYVSTRVVAGIEVFRRSMGGHGMLASSGVGRVFATELPAQTYEGENGVLSLQVARAALKSLAAAAAAKGGSNDHKAKLATSPFDAYLSALDPRPALPVQAPSTPEGWTDRAFLTRLLALRAALSVVRLADQMRSAGKKFGDLSWECADVSDAVVEAFLAKRTGEMLDALEGAGDKERDVMQRVVTLVRPPPHFPNPCSVTTWRTDTCTTRSPLSSSSPRSPTRSRPSSSCRSSRPRRRQTSAPHRLPPHAHCCRTSWA